MKRIAAIALVISMLIPAFASAEDVLINTKASKVLADKIDKTPIALGSLLAFLLRRQLRMLAKQ